MKENIEKLIGKELRKHGWRLAVAESCTGGLIGNRVTDLPGSSEYFLGGVIVYSNKSKVDLLEVLPETIEKHGSVSDQTVCEMAKGVKKRFTSSLGLAVTGIAGPDGGSREKPVGTVHIGLATDNKTFSERYHFIGLRGQVKQHSSTMALDWIRRYLNGNPFLSGV